MMTSETFTNQNLSNKLKPLQFSGTLRYKWITESRPEDQLIIRNGPHGGSFCIYGLLWREKESEKWKKALYLVRGSRKLSIMFVNELQIVVNVLRKVTSWLENKTLELEFRKLIETLKIPTNVSNVKITENT